MARIEAQVCCNANTLADANTTVNPNTNYNANTYPHLHLHVDRATFPTNCMVLATRYCMAGKAATNQTLVD